MAFTEQGIYMLMTVLRGDLAIKQSRALIRTFKRMKEAIFNTQELVDQRAYYQVMMQTSKNGSEIALLENRMVEVEKQLSDVAHRMEDTVKESDLAELMHHFAGKAEKGWVIYNTKYCSADEAYASIYGQAKRTIYVVDNYIGLRTLVLLKNAPVGVSVTLFSDNVGQQKLHHIEYNDFCLEYPHIKIQMKQTGRICHDRFIVLDYGTADARIFLCGASSKDAGARITSIVEDYGIEKYKSMIQGFLNNPPLKLV